jgi:hypothetical protein
MQGFFYLKTPEDLLHKLEREYEKVKQNPADVDHAFNFFVTAEHLPGLCREFEFWGQNPKTKHQQFNDLQTTKLSKKQICDRAGR